MAAGRELDSAEGDGALQGHLDGRLLHPILSIGPRGARDGATTEVPLYLGDAVLSGQEAFFEEALQHGADGWTVDQLQHKEVGAAAGSHGDLDGVASRLAHVLQVEGLVRGLVVSPLNGEGRGIDADLHRGRPVGIHLPVFMVVALELQLQVRPQHQGLVDRVSELEDMVAHSQVVL
jgi:hypothetical protein